MRDRRPLIGITTQSLHSIDGIPADLPTSWMMNQRYLHAVVAHGGLPVMIPLLANDDQTLRALFDRLDGVLVPGGVDLDPSAFGEARHPLCGRVDVDRDHVELQLTRWAIEERKPLFGLCRGLQVINVALGGTLFQDIAAQRPESIKHDFFPNAGYARDYLAHDVDIAPGSRLRDLLGAAAQPVNSMHHQAIKDVAPGLLVSAVAPDGVVEAVEMDRGDQFLLGVQWHPESIEFVDPACRHLFAGFIYAASRHHRGVAA
jgi:putative glutamine amidotransferase